MKDPVKNSIPTIFPDMLKAYEFRSPVSIMSKLRVLTSEDPAKVGLLEHVSVHGVDQFGNQYTPCWEEMCYIKDVFFDAEDIVIQIHPKQSQYVNMAKHVLHLWRSADNSFNTLYK